jgi:hypothetical protein
MLHEISLSDAATVPICAVPRHKHTRHVPVMQTLESLDNLALETRPSIGESEFCTTKYLHAPPQKTLPAPKESLTPVCFRLPVG